ncbi:unnamed protein product [Calypogeia fissa]
MNCLCGPRHRFVRFVPFGRSVRRSACSPGRSPASLACSLRLALLDYACCLVVQARPEDGGRVVGSAAAAELPLLDATYLYKTVELCSTLLDATQRWATVVLRLDGGSQAAEE